MGLQQRGMACGVVSSPEEVLADEHFVARGFPTTLRHDDGREVTYTGSPLRFVGTPCGPRRQAPGQALNGSGVAVRELVQQN